MTKLKWRPIASAPKDKWLFVVHSVGDKGIAILNGDKWRTAFAAVGPDLIATISVTTPAPLYWLDTPPLPKPKKRKKVTR